jgi:hypothetical protein
MQSVKGIGEVLKLVLNCIGMIIDVFLNFACVFLIAKESYDPVLNQGRKRIICAYVMKSTMNTSMI